MNAIEMKELANKKDLFAEEVRRIEYWIKKYADRGERSYSTIINPIVKAQVKAHFRELGFKVSSSLWDFIDCGYTKISW